MDRNSYLREGLSIIDIMVVVRWCLGVYKVQLARNGGRSSPLESEAACTLGQGPRKRARALGGIHMSLLYKPVLIVTCVPHVCLWEVS
jgi:hypothetical protein